MHYQRLIVILQGLIRSKNGPAHSQRKKHIHHVYELSLPFYDLLTLWACGRYGHSLSPDRIAAETADFFIDLALMEPIVQWPEMVLPELQKRLSRRMDTWLVNSRTATRDQLKAYPGKGQ